MALVGLSDVAEAQRARALGAPPTTPAQVRRLVSGSVSLPFGASPASVGVTTSEGGHTLAAPNGAFALEVFVPPAATSLTVAARALMAGVELVGSAELALTTPLLDTGTIALARPGGPFAGAIYLLAATGRLVQGDLDGDGDEDLAVAQILSFSSANISYVSVASNLGGGKFEASAQYVAGFVIDPEVPYATGQVGTDLDDDGDLDLLVLAASPIDGQVATLLGNGDGSFQAPAVLTTGAPPLDLRATDVDGDAAPDLLVLTGTGVRARSGNGDGSFGGEFVLTTSACCLRLFELCDLDADGDMDLLQASALATQVFLGNGAGSFSSAGSLSEASTILDAELRDLDEDGALDLVVGLQDGNVSIRLGNGSGGFGASSLLATGAQVSSLALADIDGDDELDLVASGLGRLRSFPGNGDGTFGPSMGDSQVAAGPIYLDELDGNAGLDLVAQTTGGGVSVHFGKGDGTFEAAGSIAANAALGITSADLDGDGALDVVGAGGSFQGRAVVLAGNGDGSFDPAVLHPVGASPIDVAAGDLDDDADLDLVLSNSNGDSLSVLLASGAGFAPHVTYASGDRPLGLALADLDADGDLDLIAANAFSETISILLGDGLGAFTSATPLVAGRTPGCLRAADFDASGTVDLVAANAGEHDLSVWLNSGGASFGAPSRPGCGGFGPGWFVLGDADGNGTLDLVVPNSGSHTVAVLDGLPNGTFAVAEAWPTGLAPISAALGDIDGDGRVDLAVACSDQYAVAVLRGQGLGNFAPFVLHRTEARPNSLLLLTLDGDVDPDLVATTPEASSLSVLLNRSVP